MERGKRDKQNTTLSQRRGATCDHRQTLQADRERVRITSKQIHLISKRSMLKFIKTQPIFLYFVDVSVSIRDHQKFASCQEPEVSK